MTWLATVEKFMNLCDPWQLYITVRLSVNHLQHYHDLAL